MSDASNPGNPVFSAIAARAHDRIARQEELRALESERPEPCWDSFDPDGDDAAGSSDDETPVGTVIETGWATIRIGGSATVFAAQVQNFVIGGMPGQGKSGTARWQMAGTTPVIASDNETDPPGATAPAPPSPEPAAQGDAAGEVARP